MIWMLALILCILLLIVGGERGAIAIMALTGNIFVLAVIILLMARGVPSLALTLVGGMIISYITLLKQNGKNKKTKAAFVSVIIVMTLLGVFIYGIMRGAGAGTLNEIRVMQEDVLYYYNVDMGINMLNVMVAVTLLSVLGTVMDTALSITSAVYEIAGHKKEMPRKELYDSGIQVGKEIIGTTMNTLLFVYLGESILLFAYLYMAQFTMETILNSRLLFQEISVMLFGLIACLLAVPISSYCIACLLKGEVFLWQSKTK